MNNRKHITKGRQGKRKITLSINEDLFLKKETVFEAGIKAGFKKINLSEVFSDSLEEFLGDFQDEINKENEKLESGKIENN